MADAARHFINEYLLDERFKEVGNFIKEQTCGKVHPKGIAGSFTSVATVGSFLNTLRSLLYVLTDKEEAT